MWLAVARHVVPTFGCGAGMDVWMPFGMNCAVDLLIGDRTSCVRGQKCLEGDARDRVFEALASIMLSSFHLSRAPTLFFLLNHCFIIVLVHFSAWVCQMDA